MLSKSDEAVHSSLQRQQLCRPHCLHERTVHFKQCIVRSSNTKTCGYFQPCKVNMWMFLFDMKISLICRYFDKGECGSVCEDSIITVGSVILLHGNIRSFIDYYDKVKYKSFVSNVVFAVDWTRPWCKCKDICRPYSRNINYGS